jgi:thymidylate synthase
VRQYLDLLERVLEQGVHKDDRTCTFFVVTSGKPCARSKRAW